MKFGNVATGFKVFREATKRCGSQWGQKHPGDAVQEGIVSQGDRRQKRTDARRVLSESLSIWLARTVQLQKPSMRCFGCAFRGVRVASRWEPRSARQLEARIHATGSTQEAGRDRRHLQHYFCQQNRELKPWRQHNAQNLSRHSLPFLQNNSLIETPLITGAFPVLPTFAAIYSIKILFV